MMFHDKHINVHMNYVTLVLRCCKTNILYQCICSFIVQKFSGNVMYQCILLEIDEDTRGLSLPQVTNRWSPFDGGCGGGVLMSKYGKPKCRP
jgi:hypothetical protein